MAEAVCAVCGNEIDPGVGQCPFCGAERAATAAAGGGPSHREVNLERGLPPVAQALDAFFLLSRTEGIIPALESSHALAHALRIAPGLPRETIIIVNLSGRGDKDVDQIERMVASGEVVPPTL